MFGKPPGGVLNGYPPLDDLHHEAETLIVGCGERITIHCQKNIEAFECHPLVSVDEGMIEYKRFSQRGCFFEKGWVKIFSPKSGLWTGQR